MIKGKHNSQSFLENIDTVGACSLFTVNFIFSVWVDGTS